MIDSHRDSFAFIIISYNHEKYIIEHLESIKFQVLTHGSNIDIDVIVNDDFSRDGTRDLINIWFTSNRNLFRNVDFLYNPENLGTCASVSNALDRVVADRCKLTAGDDVYSNENIFELSRHDDEVSMLSGRVLYLYESVIEFDLFTSIFETATEVVYKRAKSLHRFMHFSFTNAPNLVYSMACLKNRNVRDYLSCFDVVEDWPLQVSIAREFPQKRVKLIDRVLVYYRRTEGSTYIVANERFLSDKERVYDDLLAASRSLLDLIRLTSRKKALRRRGGITKKLWNVDTYFFALAAFVRLPAIIRRSRGIDMHLKQHREHYAQIQEQARLFASENLVQSA
jgi:glycosyltransferase involved in cell wall biosynthesis